MPCAACGTPFEPRGRKRFCSKFCADVFYGNRKIGPQGGVIVCAVCNERRAVYNPGKDKACHRCRDGYERQRKAAWIEANPEKRREQDRRRWKTEKRRAYHRERARKKRWAQYGFRACLDCGAHFSARGHQLRCEYHRKAPLPVLANVILGGVAVPIADRPLVRLFIAAWCDECGEPFVYVKNGPFRRFCSTSCRKRSERRELRLRSGEFRANPELRQGIFRRDDWYCHLCGKPTDPDAVAPDPWAPTIDHTIATAKNGIDTFGNVRTAHFLCNSQKRDMSVEEWRERYGRTRTHAEGPRPA